jgi:UDP-glucose 4-epimerase
VLDPGELARLLGARKVRVPPSLLRLGAAVTWRLRLQPTPEGWVDMALAVPVMDTRRAREELGWQPRHTSGEALLELMEGIREAAGAGTPPLDPAAGGPGRARELATGVGGRNP